MGKFHNIIQPAHQQFIEKQKMFFVGTAPLSEDGHINVSPKGLDCFRVFSDTEVGYMDLISSGNETSAHTLENGRITFMFCSFDETPLILRLYGKGKTILPGTPNWEIYAPRFSIFPSTRQLIIADIDLVQTSCGFGVPLFDFKGNREQHFKWAKSKGQQGLEDYIQKNNLKSLDGLNTPINQLNR